MKKIKRPVTAIETSRQLGMFKSVKAGKQRRQTVAGSCADMFKDPDPEDIFLGNQSIDTHLEEAGISEPRVLRDILGSLDWTEFEKQYKPKGRKAYHPRLMMGIVLYGVTKGVSSLRGLEQLARMDLGCMWVGGGICPDHSVLGRFINRHSEQITNEFFMAVTRRVLEATDSNCDTVVGDGTVLQAAASRYNLIKREAALEQQQKAREAAKANPDDKELQSRKALADEVAETLERRTEARKKKGKPSDKVKVSRTEPQAMVQPMKNRQRAPS